MTNIALGVSSSIAIYKACDIIRRFQDKKFQVQVIMTRNASRFISPLFFSALSGQEALCDPFEERASREISHVSLAKEVSLFLVAPATANVIGKFASGIADDFVSTFFQAVRCPVLVAPAMNEAMYLHRPTQDNIQKLKSMGVKFVEPERGYLACKEEGWGRLASPEKIVEQGLRLVKKSNSLKGKTVVVTAGPTQENMDPVRFISNRSSGKMGYELAEEAISRGADVVLISGPVNLLPPPEAEFKSIQTAEEMLEEVQKSVSRADIVVMAAAVSDFKFKEASSRKIKKQELTRRVELIRTPDILENLKSRKEAMVVVGFAAETGNLVKNAQRKMKEKGLDLIVANDVSRKEIGFESDYNQVSIVKPGGKILKTERMSKREISEIIFDQIEVLIDKKGK